MPPSDITPDTPRKKRKSAAADKQDSPNKAIKTAAHQIDEKFEVPARYRGHAKEYGDPTLYPCGAKIYIDGHYHDCPECDVTRYIMDTWTKENKRRADGNDIEPVPLLTTAVIHEVLAKMKVPLERVRLQGENWNPYMKMTIKKKGTGKLMTTARSFVAEYNDLSDYEKMQGLRPKLPLPVDFDYEAAGPSAVPYCHRVMQTEQQLTEYILYNAIADGVLPKTYVDKLAENFGAVPKGNDKHEDYAKATGVDVDELLEVVDIEVGANVDLKDYSFSPRVLAAKGMPVNIPHGREVRVDAARVAQANALALAAPATRPTATGGGLN